MTMIRLLAGLHIAAHPGRDAARAGTPSTDGRRRRTRPVACAVCGPVLLWAMHRIPSQPARGAGIEKRG